MSLSISGSQITFSDGSTQNTAPNGSFKNRIINGAMMISQRGTSFASSSVSAGDYQLDRWYAWCNNGSANATVAQSSTAPAGFINSLLFTNVSAVTVGSTDRGQLTQLIEGLNVADLAWGTASASPVTLSFWVRSSLTGQFGGSLQNSANTRSYPFSYTINSANTWEQKSITIAGDTTGTWLTTNSTGIQLNFDLGCGSTLKGTAGAWAGANYRGATGDVDLTANAGATFYITGVQLEKGSTATSFDYRPYGTELALCQRYYAKMTSSSGSYNAFGAGYNFSSTSSAIFVKYPATMRATPTASASGVRCDTQTGTSPTSIGAAYYGLDSAHLQFTNGSGLTSGQGTVLMGNNNPNAYVDFSAEL
jgi:hypothetical protein